MYTIKAAVFVCETTNTIPHLIKNKYKVPLLQLGGLKRIFLSHIAFCKKKAACSAVRLYKFSTNFPSFPMNFYYQWNPDNRTNWTTPILLYDFQCTWVFHDFPEFSTIFRIKTHFAVILIKRPFQQGILHGYTMDHYVALVAPEINRTAWQPTSQP